MFFEKGVGQIGSKGSKFGYISNHRIFKRRHPIRLNFFVSDKSTRDNCGLCNNSRPEKLLQELKSINLLKRKGDLEGCISWRYCSLD